MKYFTINKNYFGSKSHYICDTETETLIKTEELPDNILSLSSKKFNDIASVYCLKIPDPIPDNIRKAYRAIQNPLLANHTPWEFCIPKEAYTNIINEFAKTVSRQLKNINSYEYYDNIFLKTEKVLNSLSEAKVNKDLIFENLDKSFIPNENGFLEKTIYSRTNSITGRLTVSSGPRILNLKKEYKKDLFVSRFGKDGALFTLDFKCLEPRILRALVEPYQSEERDIYNKIQLDTVELIPNITRGLAKDVTLSSIYGSKISSIAERTKKPEDEIEKLFKYISDYFNFDELKLKLINQYEKENRIFIENFYGRRISTEEAQPYMLINYFTQSTGVDVSLLGFLNIINYLEELGRLNDTVFALFIIHDALILDFHKEAFHLIPTLCKLGSKEIIKFEEITFFLEHEKLSQ